MTDSPLQSLVDHYLAHLIATGHRLQSVAAYRMQLEYFVYWSDEHPLLSATLMSQDAIERYVAHLLHGMDLHTSEPVTIRERRERATKLKRFLTWGFKNGHIAIDQSPHVPPITSRGESSAKTCTYDGKS